MMDTSEQPGESAAGPSSSSAAAPQMALASSSQQNQLQELQMQQPRAQQQQQHPAMFQYTPNPQHCVPEDYLSIDSILATTANVSCTFEPATPLDFFPLIGQKAPESIGEKGHRTVMPAWMLAAGIDSICQFTPPTAYNKVNREVIAAGAKSGKLEATRLVARQRHFYTLGMFICRHVHPEHGRLIAESLLDAFTQRIGPIITRAVDINAKPRDLLDEREKHIFWAIQQSERRQREWCRREHRHSERRSTKRKHAGAANALLF